MVSCICSSSSPFETISALLSSLNGCTDTRTFKTSFQIHIDKSKQTSPVYAFTFCDVNVSALVHDRTIIHGSPNLLNTVRKARLRFGSFEERPLFNLEGTTYNIGDFIVNICRYQKQCLVEVQYYPLSVYLPTTQQVLQEFIDSLAQHIHLSPMLLPFSSEYSLEVHHGIKHRTFLYLNKITGQ
ncbi:hypothetical protein RCL1_000452 [Eukaryota sp. TZLM3-RCL]